MIATLAAVLLALAPAADRKVSFEEAKKDASKRAAYLEGAVKAAGLDGLIKSWHLQSDPKHEAALKAEYKADGRDFFFAKEIKKVLEPTEVPSLRAVLFCRDGVYAGSQTKDGVLVLGDLFALANEDEVKSVLEDYVKTFAGTFENGLKAKDREVDTAVPAVKNISTTILFKLVGQARQLENIFNGTRKVSDAFRQDAVKQYLATFKAFCAEIAKQKKIYDDNNENTLQKEIYDSLEFLRGTIQEQIKAAGYEHRIVDKATHEHALDPVKK